MIFYTVKAGLVRYKRLFKTRAIALEYFEWLENKADNSDENCNVSIEREETNEPFDLWRACNECKLGTDVWDDAQFIWRCPHCGHINE